MVLIVLNFSHTRYQKLFWSQVVHLHKKMPNISIKKFCLLNPKLQFRINLSRALLSLGLTASPLITEIRNSGYFVGLLLPAVIFAMYCCTSEIVYGRQ